MRKSENSERRALSARERRWQSRRGPGLAALLAITAALPGQAGAVPGGNLGTLSTGHYACETPGTALGPAGIRKPEFDFEIMNASSYRADGAIGSYLLIGDRVSMTSGPQSGRRFHRISRGALRELAADGTETGMRCVLATRNNS